MRSWAKIFSSLAMVTVLTLPISGAASAANAPKPHPSVVSKAGITAVQIAPAGASASQIDQAIQDYQNNQLARPNGTGDYYSYCEEGSSGLMVWTNNKAYNCYGWYYEYLNGSRISKVNMLELKALNESINPASENQLKQWCDANGTYCMIAYSIATVVGRYLWGLLFV